MKEKKIDFELYRYQILPIDRQLSIFNEYARDLDELIAKKNDIFYDEILKIEELKRETLSLTVYILMTI